MKISEIIKSFENLQKIYGNIDCVTEAGDGRSTWAEPPRPRVSYTEIWKGHPAGKKWFVTL